MRLGSSKASKIAGVELLPKSEYHVSIVAAGRLSDDPAIVAAIIEKVRAYFMEHPDGMTFQRPRW